MISWREMRGLIERGDKVLKASCSGAGRSSTISQCAPSGVWFVSDIGSSGCSTEALVKFCLDRVDGDSAPAVTDVLRALVDTGAPEGISYEHLASRLRRLQAPHGCWRSHRNLERRHSSQLTALRFRRRDPGVCSTGPWWAEIPWIIALQKKKRSLHRQFQIRSPTRKLLVGDDM